MFSWARGRAKREVKEEGDEGVRPKRTKPEAKTEVSKSPARRSVKEELSAQRIRPENNMLVLADVNQRVKQENTMLVLAEVKQKAALPERRALKTKTKTDAGVKKKRKKRKKAKHSDAAKTAADKQMALSPALQKIVGVQEMGMNSLIRYMWQKMKDRGLQNPSDGREMILDEELSSLFGYQKCGMLDLRSLLRPHLERAIAPEDLQAEVKSERLDAKQEIKREPGLLAKKEHVKTKLEPTVGRQAPRRSQAINVDTSSDTDVYSIASSSSSRCSSVRRAASSTAVAECSSDAQSQETDEPMRPRRMNVEIQSMSAKTFYFFVSDEELEDAPPETPLTASLVMKARNFNVENTLSSDEQTIEGKITRAEGGYDVAFTNLRPNRRYDLYIWDSYHFQIPLRAVRDFTIAASAEFCAFFYPPLADDVRHGAMDGDTLAQWTLEDLVKLGVDEESATRILEVIRDCLSGM